LQVVAISDRHSAVEGFRRIYRQGVSAIAIVDQDDKLVGTLSASDVRGLTADNINTVLDPVMEFLAKKHKQPRPLVTVTADGRLKDVMDKITLGKVHRAWVVDSNMYPIGVVTATDIIRIVFDAMKKEILGN